MLAHCNALLRGRQCGAPFAMGKRRAAPVPKGGEVSESKTTSSAETGDAATGGPPEQAIWAKMSTGAHNSTGGATDPKGGALVADSAKADEKAEADSKAREEKVGGPIPGQGTVKEPTGAHDAASSPAADATASAGAPTAKPNPPTGSPRQKRASTRGLTAFDKRMEQAKALEVQLSSLIPRRTPADARIYLTQWHQPTSQRETDPPCRDHAGSPSVTPPLRPLCRRRSTRLDPRTSPRGPR